MREIAIAYVAAAAVMAGLDFIWLKLTVDSLYRGALVGLIAEKPNMAGAVAFYVIYVAGVVIFAVRPGLEEADWRVSLMWGALFGFFAYATYDLTNLATLKDWPAGISLIDIAWGTFLTATAASAGTAATLALEARIGW
jgi:uncharacterized membrane protein